MRRKRQTLLKALVACIALILVLGIVYSGLQILELTVFYGQEREFQVETKTITRRGVKYFPRQDISVILLMGINQPGTVHPEKPNHGNSADMVALVVVDEATESWSVLNLNRDAMVDMPELDLYGTIEAAVCALDSLNHITDEKLVKKTIERVALFTEPGGVFVFDVNTQYKHREVLGNNVFVYDYDEVYCVWQNSYDPQTDIVNMELDLFENVDGAYFRSSENIAERAYSDAFWRETLTEYGFGEIHCFHEDSFDEPRADSQRVVYAAVKK